MRELTEALDPEVARLRAEQLARWEAGDRVLIEALLQTPPSDEALLDLLYGEVLLREEFGERAQAEEYTRRFPRLADALRRQLEFHGALAALETEKPVRVLADTLPLTSAVHAGATTQRNGESAPPSPASPKVIGNYEILEEIGRGGMGVVYRARHRLLSNRFAAVKVIRAGNGSEERARFEAEARAVAELRHPNIVPIYELGTHAQDGQEMPFVALEYVERGSLARAIDGTPLPPRDAAALLLPLAEAVAHAHRAGIIHRDLKPANVLLSEPAASATSSAEPVADAPRADRFIPKITDFGLAKRLGADTGQTRTGAILGTPSYMAPEQAEGRTDEIGVAADIYALGAILYEALTGRPPFKADTVLNTLHQVATLEPVPPRTINPALPRDLETICLKCLQKELQRRYASAADLARDLERYLRGEPILARPVGFLERGLKWMKRRPAAAALVGVSGLALVGLIALWVFFTLRLQEQTRNALEQRDEADRQKKIAVEKEGLAKQEAEKARKQSERAAHILDLAAASVDEIVTGARAGKTEELKSGNTGTVLFKMACTYARTSAALMADTNLPQEDRARLAGQFAMSAVRLLRCAQQVGFFGSGRPENRKALETSAELNCLRDRQDFKSLLAELR
jgi:hypothetical protein